MRTGITISYSRRRFLAGLGGIAATTVVAPRLPCYAFANLGFRIAVISDEISQDFAHACQVASQEFGLAWIEIRNLWNKSVLDLSPREIEEAKRVLNLYKLRVTDIASPLFKTDWKGAPKSKFSQMHGEFSSNYTYEQQDELLERCIAIARAFSTDRIRCFDFLRSDDTTAYRTAINQKLLEAATKAGKQGLILILENEVSCNTSTAREAEAVLAEVQSPHFMLNWDAANAAAAGEIPFPDGYRLLPKLRIGHCHCRDIFRTPGSTDFEWAPVGRGTIDWVGMFRALQNDGYQAAVSLETHWRGAGTAEASTRQSWAGMREDLAAAGISGAFLAPSKAIGANDRVRIGIIGIGERGQQLLRQIQSLPNAEVAAVADVYSARLTDAKEAAPKIDTYQEYRKILDRKDIDAVVVATPLHLHARHFLDSLAAGKDLYSEKTMTWSIQEADQCLAAAKKSDRVIQIGLQFQSSGALTDAKKWINDGMVGKITEVVAWKGRNTVHGQGEWVKPIPSDCTQQNVDWKAFLNGHTQRPFDAYEFVNWRLFWEFSGGNVSENMVHQLAWIMGVLDLPLPSAACATGGIFLEKDRREVPDTLVVTFDFPNDLLVTWQSTFGNGHYGTGEHLLGTDGTIEHLVIPTDYLNGRGGNVGIHYFPEKINRPDGLHVAGQTPDQNHMANFIDCIHSRKQPNAPVELGYCSAIAGHMANLAYRHKRRLTFEEAKALVV